MRSHVDARHRIPAGTTAPWRFALLVLVISGGFAAPSHGQHIHRLTKNWYRVPYASEVDGQPTDLTGVGHGPNNLFGNGHNGHDVIGLPAKAYNDPSPHKIVAMADGRVVEVEDRYFGCGNPDPSCTEADCCNNRIWIRHHNEEYTAYYHIAINSARVQVGDCVVSGQYIADEGDVGYTGRCDSPLDRPKRGCNDWQDQSDYVTDDCANPTCGVHLHIGVLSVHDPMASFDLLLLPRICGLPDRVLQSNVNIALADVGACSTTECPQVVIVGQSFSGQQKVVVASDRIETTGSQQIVNSVIGYEAGQRIRLRPGFRAASGCYFRASIGTCQAQPAGCPAP